MPIPSRICSINFLLTALILFAPQTDGLILLSGSISPVRRQSGLQRTTLPLSLSSGVHHRRLINVIRSVFQESIMFTFHLTPSLTAGCHTTMSKAVESLYSEAYASEAMADAHEGIRSLPRAPDDNLERIVAPLMLWSDLYNISRHWYGLRMAILSRIRESIKVCSWKALFSCFPSCCLYPISNVNFYIFDSTYSSIF